MLTESFPWTSTTGISSIGWWVRSDAIDVASDRPAIAASAMQVTRQKLPKDWNKRLQAIHAKATDALKDAPTEVQKDTPLDYLRAVEIRDALAAKGERTMFGGLTGHAATWDKIVKAYENGGEQGAAMR